MKCTLSQADSIHKYTLLSAFPQSLLLAVWVIPRMELICKIFMFIDTVNRMWKTFRSFYYGFGTIVPSESFCIQIRCLYRSSCGISSVPVGRTLFSGLPSSLLNNYCRQGRSLLDRTSGFLSARQSSRHLLSPPEVPLLPTPTVPISLAYVPKHIDPVQPTGKRIDILYSVRLRFFPPDLAQLLQFHPMLPGKPSPNAVRSSRYDS